MGSSYTINIGLAAVFYSGGIYMERGKREREREWRNESIIHIVQGSYVT